MATDYKAINNYCAVFKESTSVVRVTSHYGNRSDPISGAASFHKGVDLVHPNMASPTIVAIADGTIKSIYTDCPGLDTVNQTAGNRVDIDHGNGMVSRYFHLAYGSNKHLKVGDVVTKGFAIGIMGTTGYSTGNHLHFQIDIYNNGTRTGTVDPLPYLTDPMKQITSKGVDPSLVTQATMNTTQYTSNAQTQGDGSGYRPSTGDILSESNHNVSDSEFVKISNVSGVFGLPYQFLPTADLRLDGSEKTENIGYEYAEKIIERIPLLFLSPGKASFMTKYSNAEKQNIMEKLVQMGSDQESASLSDLLNSDGRYYTFEYDQTRYYKFVNPMCRIAARYLNIQDVKINGTKLDNFNWETMTKSGISSIADFGNYLAIPFYVDTDTSISESFGNSTTQSQLASTVNGVSDMAKELNFLLGYGAGSKSIDQIMSDTGIAESMEVVNNLAKNLLNSGGFFSNLSSHLVTVASGGKLVFPEIWSDSSYSRSFNVRFKFISPDCSNLSVFLNVLVPLFHLLGLVAPQMSYIDKVANPNGYTNPFLVRAVYKGFFNIDMGIIESMSVNKGAECQWTPEGVPTSIEVDIGIKDLYNMLSITETNSTDGLKYDTLNNTVLMDYIANLCGINIFKPEITRLIDMWYTNNFENRVADFFEVNIWGGIQQKIQNLIMGIYR